MPKVLSFKCDCCPKVVTSPPRLYSDMPEGWSKVTTAKPGASYDEVLYICDDCGAEIGLVLKPIKPAVNKAVMASKMPQVKPGSSTS